MGANPPMPPPTQTSLNVVEVGEGSGNVYAGEIGYLPDPTTQAPRAHLHGYGEMIQGDKVIRGRFVHSAPHGCVELSTRETPGDSKSRMKTEYFVYHEGSPGTGQRVVPSGQGRDRRLPEECAKAAETALAKAAEARLLASMRDTVKPAFDAANWQQPYASGPLPSSPPGPKPSPPTTSTAAPTATLTQRASGTAAGRPQRYDPLVLLGLFSALMLVVFGWAMLRLRSRSMRQKGLRSHRGRSTPTAAAIRSAAKQLIRQGTDALRQRAATPSPTSSTAGPSATSNPKPLSASPAPSPSPSHNAASAPPLSLPCIGGGTTAHLPNNGKPPLNARQLARERAAAKLEERRRAAALAAASAAAAGASTSDPAVQKAQGKTAMQARARGRSEVLASRGAAFCRLVLRGAREVGGKAWAGLGAAPGLLLSLLSSAQGLVQARTSTLLTALRASSSSSQFQPPSTSSPPTKSTSNCKGAASSTSPSPSRAKKTATNAASHSKPPTSPAAQGLRPSTPGTDTATRNGSVSRVSSRGASAHSIASASRHLTTSPEPIPLDGPRAHSPPFPSGPSSVRSPSPSEIEDREAPLPEGRTRDRGRSKGPPTPTTHRPLEEPAPPVTPGPAAGAFSYHAPSARPRPSSPRSAEESSEPPSHSGVVGCDRERKQTSSGRAREGQLQSSPAVSRVIASVPAVQPILKRPGSQLEGESGDHLFDAPERPPSDEWTSAGAKSQGNGHGHLPSGSSSGPKATRTHGKRASSSRGQASQGQSHGSNGTTGATPGATASRPSTGPGSSLLPPAGSGLSRQGSLKASRLQSQMSTSSVGLPWADRDSLAPSLGGAAAQGPATGGASYSSGVVHAGSTSSTLGGGSGSGAGRTISGLSYASVVGEPDESVGSGTGPYGATGGAGSSTTGTASARASTGTQWLETTGGSASISRSGSLSRRLSAAAKPFEPSLSLSPMGGSPKGGPEAGVEALVPSLEDAANGAGPGQGAGLLRTHSGSNSHYRTRSGLPPPPPPPGPHPQYINGSVPYPLPPPYGFFPPTPTPYYTFEAGQPILVWPGPPHPPPPPEVLRGIGFPMPFPPGFVPPPGYFQSERLSPNAKGRPVQYLNGETASMLFDPESRVPAVIVTGHPVLQKAPSPPPRVTEPVGAEQDLGLEDHGEGDRKAGDAAEAGASVAAGVELGSESANGLANGHGSEGVCERPAARGSDSVALLGLEEEREVLTEKEVLMLSPIASVPSSREPSMARAPSSKAAPEGSDSEIEVEENGTDHDARGDSSTRSILVVRRQRNVTGLLSRANGVRPLSAPIPVSYHPRAAPPLPAPSSLASTCGTELETPGARLKFTGRENAVRSLFPPTPSSEDQEPASGSASISCRGPTAVNGASVDTTKEGDAGTRTGTRQPSDMGSSVEISGADAGSDAGASLTPGELSLTLTAPEGSSKSGLVPPLQGPYALPAFLPYPWQLQPAKGMAYLPVWPGGEVPVCVIGTVVQGQPVEGEPKELEPGRPGREGLGTDPSGPEGAAGPSSRAELEEGPLDTSTPQDTTFESSGTAEEEEGEDIFYRLYVAGLPPIAKPSPSGGTAPHVSEALHVAMAAAPAPPKGSIGQVQARGGPPEEQLMQGPEPDPFQTPESATHRPSVLPVDPGSPGGAILGLVGARDRVDSVRRSYDAAPKGSPERFRAARDLETAEEDLADALRALRKLE